MISDAELVKQVIKGEKRDLNELFRRYEKHLFAFLYSKVKNRELALDILQETFIDAFTGISNLREKSVKWHKDLLKKMESNIPPEKLLRSDGENPCRIEIKKRFSNYLIQLGFGSISLKRQIFALVRQTVD